MNKIIITIAIFIFIAAPVYAPKPPATPTELNLNLLNTNSSNIDTSLLLTVDYTDSGNNAQTLDSVTNSTIVEWGIFGGYSNLYSLPPAKDGTNITITIAGGYEPIDEVAQEGVYVGGTYYLSRLYNPATDKSSYNIGETVTVTWSATGTPQMSNYILVVFYNENDAVTEELAAVSPSATSYAGHTVGANEIGKIIRVYIYYADGASDPRTALGTSDPISTAYAGIAAPEFPLGPAILFGIFIPIYFSMRRRFLENVA